MAVMAPTMMNTALHNQGPQYIRSPTDALDRHEFGIHKNRKPASTGGGRAWSEDEEVYLLQTRLQKMPYKHIAAHLKKSELACRLHYHQLSHGSNRRKRTSSMSSGSSFQSLSRDASVPSTIAEHTSQSSPPCLYGYSPRSPGNVQLPPATILLSGSTSPPRPVAILPKPSPQRPTAATTPLRLNCSAEMLASFENIDKERLRRAYESHRGAFWHKIAAEYGEFVNPILLEEAWRLGSLSAPLTPCISPDSSASVGYYGCCNIEEKKIERKESATSISSLLGIDASPRSPKERELIKRLEEGVLIDVR